MGDATPPRDEGTLRRALAVTLLVLAALASGMAARGPLWHGGLVAGRPIGAVVAAGGALIALLVAAWAAVAWPLRRLAVALGVAAVVIVVAWSLGPPVARGWLFAALAGVVALQALLRSSDRAAPAPGPTIKIFATYAVISVAMFGLYREPVPLLAGVRVVERTRRRCPDGQVYLEGGTFSMGYEGGEAREKPEHRVTVRSFCIDRTEVTVAAWRACVEAGACQTPERYAPTRGEWQVFCNWERAVGDGGVASYDQHPINCVSPTEADAYCAWRGGRLPTEDEWEFAAHGTVGRRYPWGDTPEPSPQNSNLCGDECFAYARSVGYGNWTGIDGWRDPWQTTARVDALPPAGNTPEGLVGMAGNVWEWTSTPWGDYRAGDAGVTEYRDVDRNLRVLRGGGWGTGDTAWARASLRLRFDTRGEEVGFRCASEGP